jgi:hypothetical protein
LDACDQKQKFRYALNLILNVIKIQRLKVQIISEEKHIQYPNHINKREAYPISKSYQQKRSISNIQIISTKEKHIQYPNHINKRKEYQKRVQLKGFKDQEKHMKSSNQKIRTDEHERNGDNARPARL